jgi:hypothetical protein
MKPEDFERLYVSTARAHGMKISEEVAKRCIETFADTLQRSLLEYPTVSIKDVGTFSVVPLSDRIRVLRGKVYPSRLRYKVRYYVTDAVQEKLCEVYDPLREEDLSEK